MPDPTLLLIASNQVPNPAAYGALTVPSLPAGGFYTDPLTGIKVWKLTSPISPAPATNWNHDYAEGGDEVSLPHTGQTRSILIRQNGSQYWLIDFTPGSGVSNGRPIPSTLAPYMDVAFCFSNNPATPYYAYSCVGWPSTTIKRWDVRTMAEAPGGFWPKTGEDGARWLHQAENDSLFCWMLNNGGPIIGFDPATGTRKSFTIAGTNEPRIDRAGKYILVSLSGNGLQVIDFDAGNLTWSLPGDPGIPFAHVALLRRRAIGVDWNISFPDKFYKLDPSVPGSAVHLNESAAPGTQIHGNGNWIQHPADLDDQWAAFSHYGSFLPQPLGPAWLAPGGIILMTPKGQRRLLCHSYNSRGDYAFLTFPKLSPDGAYLLFNSDMVGSGRTDVFLAELPGAAIVSPPPPIDVTAPTISSVLPSAVTQTSAAISWGTSEPADAQVEYGPSTAYGSSTVLDPTMGPAHSQVLSGLTPGTLYHYRVKSRDAATNLAISSDFTFTTQSPIIPPPPLPATGTYSLQLVDSTGKVIWKTPFS